MPFQRGRSIETFETFLALVLLHCHRQAQIIWSSTTISSGIARKNLERFSKLYSSIWSQTSCSGCMRFMCRLKFPDCLKQSLQNLHLYGFSPVWTKWCLCRLVTPANVLKHILHSSLLWEDPAVSTQSRGSSGTFKRNRSISLFWIVFFGKITR